MSMDRCTRCDRLIDTDFFPEVYREELDYECICESCMDAIDEARDQAEALESGNASK